MSLLTLSVTLVACSVPAETTTSCPTDFSPIHEIQGADFASPQLGERVTTRGIVTTDWRAEGELGGFFIQSLPADQDNDKATSEGLFVYHPNPTQPLEVGDIVSFSGAVQEYQQATQLGKIQGLQVCGKAAVPAPVQVQLPVENEAAFEALEGMRVHFSQPLIINGHYQLQRFGEMVLSHERLYTPSQRVNGKAKVDALLAKQALQRIGLDDNSQVQNPAIIPFPSPALTMNNYLRSGDQVVNLTGFISEFNGRYKVQPEQPVEIERKNPRPEPPSAPAVTDIRIASFNVLNYFNGDGTGGGFPTPRGAENKVELQRQEQKIVTAILALKADVVGLMEIENDGYYKRSAIAQLTQALSRASGQPWQFVAAPNPLLGTDQITNGIIYRADRVTLAGTAKALLSQSFDWGSRPPFAQTFRGKSTDTAAVTVVVNHFKSKGSCPKQANDPNANQQDGQACWNALRTASAQALSAWLQSEAMQSMAAHQVVLGDFNAYAQEDPMRAFANAGYRNLMTTQQPDAYSYVYDAQAGSLDHILISPSLASRVSQIAHWHINADEPGLFEYGLEDKTPSQAKQWYDDGPYRSSDHDPLYIDIAL